MLAAIEVVCLTKLSCPVSAARRLVREDVDVEAIRDRAKHDARLTDRDTDHPRNARRVR
jgi:hypothetical protein